MFINNQSIENYGAELHLKEIGTKNIEIDGEWIKNKYTIKGKQELSIPIKAELIVKGENLTELKMNISHIVKEASLVECSIKFEDIDFFYDCILISSDTKYIGEDFMEDKETSLLSLEFDAYYQYDEEKIINFNKSNNLTLYVGGNDTTPAILEITPSVNVSTVNITGLGEEITLNNLTTNNTIIIDGVKGLITENSDNKFPDYDSWGFPKLEPGENNIFVDNDTLDIVIKYNPRWI